MKSHLIDKDVKLWGFSPNENKTFNSHIPSFQMLVAFLFPKITFSKLMFVKISILRFYIK